MLSQALPRAWELGLTELDLKQLGEPARLNLILPVLLGPREPPPLFPLLSRKLQGRLLVPLVSSLAILHSCVSSSQTPGAFYF